MKGLAILFLVAGACLYLVPAFNGLFSSRLNFSSEEGHFAGAILGMSGLIFFAISEKGKL
jgi:hypothetical protein